MDANRDNACTKVVDLTRNDSPSTFIIEERGKPKAPTWLFPLTVIWWHRVSGRSESTASLNYSLEPPTASSLKSHSFMDRQMDETSV